MAKSLLNRYFIKLSTIVLVALLAIPVGLLQQIPLSNAEAQTFTVTNTNDAGPGSLREAIASANANAGADTIEFSVSGTLTLGSALPSLAEEVTINGASAPDDQAGADFIIDATGFDQGLRIDNGVRHVIKGLAIRNATSNCIVINGVSQTFIGGTASREFNEIDGCPNGISIENNSALITIRNNKIGETSANDFGIYIDSGSDLQIGDSLGGTHNVIVNSTVDGIKINGGDGINIYGNYIGIDSSGVQAANGQDGISISNTASNVIIGGETAGHRNIISGNTNHGLKIQADGTQISGNYIGTNLTGDAAIANGNHGIQVEAADDVLIGGGGSQFRNIISGNTGVGINFGNGTSDSPRVTSNYIGLAADGITAMPNGQDGITSFGITNGRIGADGEANYISGNAWNGISMTGDSAGTNIFSNIIGLGIDESIVANGFDGIEINTSFVSVGGPESANRNIISGNGQRGLNIRGNNNVIRNNYIGVASDGTTSKPNTQDCITIDEGSNNIIGGDTEAEGNILAINTNQKGVDVANDSSGNKIRNNTFIPPNAGGWTRIHFMDDNTSNEGVASPTVDPASTDTYAYGTTCSNCIVDVMTDDMRSSTSANAEGDWEIHAAMTGDHLFFTTTKSSGSTSRDLANVILIPDETAPTAPTVTSATITDNENYTLEGTKEAYSRIIENVFFMEGVTTIVEIDALTTWSYAATLEEGDNTFSLTSDDYKENESDPATSFTVTLDTIAPSTPTYSYSSTVSTASTTISGSGTEAEANVYLSGIDSGTNTDNTGSFSITVDLATGVNSIPIKIVDEAGNESAETTLTITRSADSVGFFGGASQNSNRGSNNNSSNNNTTSNNDTTSNNNETEAAEEASEETSENTTNENTETENVAEENEVTNPKPVEPAYVPQPYYYEPVYTAPTNTEIEENVEETEPTTAEIVKTIIESNASVTKVKNLDIFEEIINKTNADLSDERDTDGDGISDLFEAALGTNAKSNDSDDDGITDEQEVKDGTDPGNWDSDGDGIPDNEEAADQVNKFNKLEVPEVKKIEHIANAGISIQPEQLGNTDTDGDGISDLEELGLGTDPTDPDSDKDGIKDGEEYINYGTNPKTPTEASVLKDLRITNLLANETLPAGRQVISGRSDSEETIKFYLIKENGETEFFAETKSDETGKYNVLTKDLKEGQHTIIAVSGDKTVKDISQAITVNVVASTGVQKPVNDETVMKEGANFTHEAKLKIAAPANHKVVVTWQSTVFSQTSIVDATGSPIALSQELPHGKHTVTFASISPENVKSEPTQISFEVGPQTAFVSGDTRNTSALKVIFGALALLTGLITLAVVIRKRKNA